jgi:hypothetical protein
MSSSDGGGLARYTRATSNAAVAWLVFSAVTPTLAEAPIGATSSAAADTKVAIAAGPANPHWVMSKEACVKCHAAEIQVWKQTPHARTFDELHRRPEAKQIANRLGQTSIKHSGRCVGCHYTQQVDPASGQLHVIAGVSCESCHGAARGWIEIHHDYGGQGITRLSESPEHRKQRIGNSVVAGMRNPYNVYSIAQSCLRCHTTGDEELVNVGGHSVGSLDFEFVSWSQGMVRHNFVRSDGQTNDVSPPERIRVMFVAGIIAELEASLRATAVATQKATYGITVAQRASRAGARIESVAAKVDSPTLNEIVARYQAVELRLNNAAELTVAADRIALLGYQFAAYTDGRSLVALDPFIPTGDRFK